MRDLPSLILSNCFFNPFILVLSKTSCGKEVHNLIMYCVQMFFFSFIVINNFMCCLLIPVYKKEQTIFPYSFLQFSLPPVDCCILFGENENSNWLISDIKVIRDHIYLLTSICIFIVGLFWIPGTRNGLSVVFRLWIQITAWTCLQRYYPLGYWDLETLCILSGYYGHSQSLLFLCFVPDM